MRRYASQGLDGPAKRPSVPRSVLRARWCWRRGKTANCRLFFSSRRRHTRCLSDWEFRRVLFRSIVMIDPTNLTANQVPPKIHIQSVRANGQELYGVSGAVARPGNGELEFHYAGISYLAPLKIKYRYKLDGYEIGRATRRE